MTPHKLCLQYLSEETLETIIETAYLHVNKGCTNPPPVVYPLLHGGQFGVGVSRTWYLVWDGGLVMRATYKRREYIIHSRGPCDCVKFVKFALSLVFLEVTSPDGRTCMNLDSTNINAS